MTAAAAALRQKMEHQYCTNDNGRMIAQLKLYEHRNYGCTLGASWCPLRANNWNVRESKEIQNANDLKYIYLCSRYT